jgi:hypothetical protein
VFDLAVIDLQQKAVRQRALDGSRHGWPTDRAGSGQLVDQFSEDQGVRLGAGLGQLDALKQPALVVAQLGRKAIAHFVSPARWWCIAPRSLAGHRVSASI